MIKEINMLQMLQSRIGLNPVKRKSELIYKLFTVGSLIGLPTGRYFAMKNKRVMLVNEEVLKPVMVKYEIPARIEKALYLVSLIDELKPGNFTGKDYWHFVSYTMFHIKSNRRFSVIGSIYDLPLTNSQRLSISKVSDRINQLLKTNLVV